jgi:hypothetical protein
MCWTDLAQDRDRWWTFVNEGMNLRVPQNAGNFLTTYGTVSFSEKIMLHGIRVHSLHFCVSKTFCKWGIKTCSCGVKGGVR